MGNKLRKSNKLEVPEREEPEKTREDKIIDRHAKNFKLIRYILFRYMLDIPIHYNWLKKLQNKWHYAEAKSSKNPNIKVKQVSKMIEYNNITYTFYINEKYKNGKLKEEYYIIENKDDKDLLKISINCDYIKLYELNKKINYDDAKTFFEKDNQWEENDINLDNVKIFKKMFDEFTIDNFDKNLNLLLAYIDNVLKIYSINMTKIFIEMRRIKKLVHITFPSEIYIYTYKTKDNKEIKLNIVFFSYIYIRN